MHHKFGLTPFPLTSTRTKRPSVRVAPQASPISGGPVELTDAAREETPVAGSATTTNDLASEEGAE